MDALKLFVFGAGYSARAAISALQSSGDVDVAATTRSRDKVEALKAQGITAHVFDGAGSAPDLLSDLAEATHVLVSVAPGAEDDPVLTHHRADIVAAPRLEWIGYYSTIGVYGDAEGAWIDESAPTEPLSARNRYRLDAEAGWQDLAREIGVPLAILRLAGIYGPGRSPFDKLRKGTARRIDKPGQVFNRIHVEDIGAITALAAQKRLDGIFNVCDDEPAPPQDVIGHAAEAIGVEPPPLIDFDQAELSPMARTFYAGNRRVANKRIKAALGYALKYPTYREGHRAVLAQERD